MSHNEHAAAQTNGVPSSASGKQRRVIMCFDGTGNKFTGTESDTNIVKLYRMMDRQDPNQFHYYQPGIGTYGKDGSLSSASTLAGGFRASIVSAVDQAIGTSFVDHLLAGYKFLMKHYCEGDQLYIFGFSRGAYTARFLAEMIHDLGLLSQGNEEMIHFAWETYSAYQRCEKNPVKNTKEQKHLLSYMKKFSHTFCRSGVLVHFLGLFDCVNSVGQFEVPLFRITSPYLASAPARHIRHAVSIHEQRVKFKPALFLTDPDFRDEHNKTLKELWFAGDHSDVGGGWSIEVGEMGLLSDKPLQWMLEEVQNIPDTPVKLTFRRNYEKFLGHRETKDYRPSNIFGWIIWALGWLIMPKFRPAETPHHSLTIGAGSSVVKTLFWWIIEILPIFTRHELEDGKWVLRRYPNLGRARDIPANAEIHASVNDYVARGKIAKPRTGGGKGLGFAGLLSWINVKERFKWWKNVAKSKMPSEE
ncbi:uncharacterized protein BCR38DRAFT_335461 [Pseudomassariella vexata]|uniref:T6SS Phospholipase effector Tle1-like catalytic domain-containing protein n=1 Tax=Pseudomassariella vexata TaxID=1141098 RepID=A0A1Y2EBP7_9PEZI|nr:uncharacterized protein BCR38DRAFT_335461 [Pseudomassariella vexata]ORY68275.1 hypothetical protein BCR38DRAFT_335461 [Pseudomassariella vexata]